MPTFLRDQRKNPKLWRAALVCYVLALVIGTHLPGTTPVLPADGIDKLFHFAAYAGLAAILATTWQLAAGHLHIRHLVLLWLAIAVFAAFDEWTQIPVGRDGSVWDWVADSAGALVALLVFAKFSR